MSDPPSSPPLETWSKPPDLDSLSTTKKFYKSDGFFLKPTTPIEIHFYSPGPPHEALELPVPPNVDPSVVDPTTVTPTVRRFARCPEQLRPLVTDYFGSREVDGVEHLVLKDLTHGMRNPVLCDVKLGTRAWDMFADRAKIDKMNAKYAGYEHYRIWGFHVVLMRLWAPSENGENDGTPKFVSVGNEKSWGRSLTNWNQHVVGDFGTRLVSLMTDVQKERFLQQFAQLDDLWTRFGAEQLLLYASSLMIVYDAAAGLGHVPEGGVSPDYDPNAIFVKIIDFAHSFYRRDHPGLDDGCLRGIRNLRRVFLKLIHGTAGDLRDDPDEEI